MKKYIFSLLFVFLISSNLNAQKTKYKTLTKTELNNITSFAKAYGIVRHFHPSTEIQNFELWEEFLINGINKVRKAKSRKGLNKILEEIFKPLAPSIKFSNRNNKSYFKQQKKFKSDSIIFKKNIGWSDKKRAQTRSKSLYLSSFEKTNTNKLKSFLKLPEIKNTYKISSSTYMYLPQTLYYNNSRSLPMNKLKTGLNSIENFDFDNSNVRIASIILFWNVMQHFYPYLEMSNINPNTILDKYILMAFSSESENFIETLQKLSHEYKDGHCLVMENTKTQDGWEHIPPFRVENIENKSVVVWVDKTANNEIQIGDEILSIDGVDIKSALLRSSKRVSGSTDGFVKFMAYRWLLIGNGKKNSMVSFKIKTKDGDIIEKSFKRNLKEWFYRHFPNQEITYKEYKKDYYYLNMLKISDSTFNYLIDNKFPTAKGIIIDGRNSKSHRRYKEFLGHLSKDTLNILPVVVPTYYFPNQEKKNIERENELKHIWSTPQLPKFTNNVAFIIDNQMYSGRETVIAIVNHYNLGITVGRKTGGTNGNTSMNKLFDKYTFFFTGIEAFQYDGSTFQGIGIKPDIEVREYKLNDLFNGKDTFIEKAKEIIK